MHQFNLQGTTIALEELQAEVADIQCPACGTHVTLVQDPADQSFFADLPCECGAEPA